MKLSDIKKKLILKEFYRTKLRKGEKVVDNRTSVIAKKVKVSEAIVSKFLDIHLDDKFDDLFNKEQEQEQDYQLRYFMLKQDYNKLKKSYEILEKTKNLKHDKLKLIKKCIKEGKTTTQIFKEVGYKNTRSLYSSVKRRTGLNYVEYKEMILNRSY